LNLTKNIRVETKLRGANVGFIFTEDGVVMIDSPLVPSQTLALKKEVQKRGTIKYLINTEPHEDHFTGSFFIGCTAVAHQKAREDMLVFDIARLKQMVSMENAEDLPLMEGYRINIPTITFSNSLTLYLGKHTFNLFHMPGHSAGQTAVFVPEERVVFTGDNITYQISGFLHEADPDSWLNSLKRIGDLEVDYIVGGHGEVCDKSYLPIQAKYVQTCVETVKQAVDKGWTKQEAVARIVWPNYLPLHEGSEPVAPMLNRLAIENLYDRLSRK